MEAHPLWERWSYGHEDVVLRTVHSLASLRQVFSLTIADRERFEVLVDHENEILANCLRHFLNDPQYLQVKLSLLQRLQNVQPFPSGRDVRSIMLDGMLTFVPLTTASAVSEGSHHSAPPIPAQVHRKLTNTFGELFKIFRLYPLIRGAYRWIETNQDRLIAPVYLKNWKHDGVFKPMFIVEDERDRRFLYLNLREILKYGNINIAGEAFIDADEDHRALG